MLAQLPRAGGGSQGLSKMRAITIYSATHVSYFSVSKFKQMLAYTSKNMFKKTKIKIKK